MSPSTDLQHLQSYSSQTSGWRVVAAGAALANRVSEDVQQRPVLPPGQAPRERLRANTAACGTKGKVTRASSFPAVINRDSETKQGSCSANRPSSCPLSIFLPLSSGQYNGNVKTAVGLQTTRGRRPHSCQPYLLCFTQQQRPPFSITGYI